MLRAAAALPLVIAAAAGVATASASPGTATEQPAGGPALQEMLDRVTAAGASGALALVRGPGGVWAGASGVTELGRSERPSPRSRFRAGSNTKPFVATVVLQLAGEGRVRLDAPVATYLPRVLDDGASITVRQLLNHTSGLADYADDVITTAAGLPDSLRRTRTPQELIAIGAGRPRLAAPGAAFSYSNTGYLILGRMVEAVTRDTIENQVRRRIIDPLGLRDTSLPRTDTRIAGPHLHGYTASDGPDGPFTDATRLIDVTSVNPSFAGASGALVSSNADLDRFFTALLTGRLLSPALLKQMQTTVDASALFGPGTGYGLGLIRLPLPCGGEVWGHGGNIFGYASLDVFSPDASRAVLEVHSLDPEPPSAPLFANAAALVSSTMCPPSAKAAA